MNKQGKGKIEYLDYTWNPVTGCLHKCKDEYCYAADIAHRFEGYSSGGGITTFCPYENAELNEPLLIMRKNRKLYKAPYPFGFRPTLHRYKLDEPQKVKKPSVIGVVYMGDLFGEWVPDEWINEVMKAISKAPQHTYISLTKNPDRYGDYFDSPWQSIPEEYDFTNVKMLLGTSITKQQDLYKLNPNTLHMLDFLSIEPLLDEVDLDTYLYDDFNSYSEWVMKWVIVGAQTGPGAVPPNPEWVQSILDQCRAAGVPVFLKDNLNWHEKIQEFPE